MKKLFTFIAMMLLATMSSFADITIYVQADVAPYLYVYSGVVPGGAGGELNGGWPGKLFTEQEEVKGTLFWKKTFEGATSMNIIFNNGSGAQTADIVAVTSDRYFTYDGARSYTDVTAEYGEVVKVVVNNVKIAGDFTKPTWAEGWQDMTVVEEGKQYTFDFDATDLGGDYQFKIVANEAVWLGYTDFEFVDDPEEMLQPATNNNVQLNNSVSGYQKYRITATWDDTENDITKGWELAIEGTELRQGDIPDAVINRLTIAGDFNGWTGEEFTEVEANKTYTHTMDASNYEEDITGFKLVVNDKDWLGNDQFAITAPAGWIQEVSDENPAGENVLFNLAAAGTKVFNMTATWEGGKDAGAGWALTIEAGEGDSTGISEVNNSQSATVYYNLQGIQTNRLQRGLYITNGRKVVVK